MAGGVLFFFFFLQNERKIEYVESYSHVASDMRCYRRENPMPTRKYARKCALTSLPPWIISSFFFFIVDKRYTQYRYLWKIDNDANRPFDFPRESNLSLRDYLIPFSSLLFSSFLLSYFFFAFVFSRTTNDITYTISLFSN